MTIGILFLSWVLVFCVSGNLAEAFDVRTLSAGGNHTCAIDIEGVKCWGENLYGQNEVPPLKNPKAVSAGFRHTCAIDDEGVKCWGSYGQGQTQVPFLKHPTSVSAGVAHTCALDDEGVKCWGWNEFGQVKVPPLKNPTAVSAGSYHTCAIDEEGVKCWGWNLFDQVKVPPLKHPISVSAGWNRNCSIDEEGVKCWGQNDYDQNRIPTLKNPSAILAGGGKHTCALDEEGVKCWGNGYDGETKVMPLKGPTSVSVGYEHSCAIDNEGVKCWGENLYGQINVLPLILVSLGRPDDFFDYLARWSTPVRTSFFNSLKLFANDKLKSPETSLVPDQVFQGQYFLVALIKASIETGDSAYYIEKIIPGYISRMKTISEQAGIQNLDQVKDFPLTRLISLKVMQSALFTMTEFLAAEDKANIQDIIKLIGLAMSDVSNKQNITNALAAIDVNESIISKLNHASKTRFLVLTLQTAQQWLKTKIQ